MEFFVFPVVGRCVLHMMCGCSDGAVTVGGEGGEGEWGRENAFGRRVGQRWILVGHFLNT